MTTALLLGGVTLPAQLRSDTAWSMLHALAATNSTVRAYLEDQGLIMRDVPEGAWGNPAEQAADYLAKKKETT